MSFTSSVLVATLQALKLSTDYKLKADLLARLTAHDLNLPVTPAFKARSTKFWSYNHGSVLEEAENIKVSAAGPEYQIIARILLKEFGIPEPKAKSKPQASPRREPPQQRRRVREVVREDDEEYGEM